MSRLAVQVINKRLMTAAVARRGIHRFAPLNATTTASSAPGATMNSSTTAGSNAYKPVATSSSYTMPIAIAAAAVAGYFVYQYYYPDATATTQTTKTTSTSAPPAQATSHRN